MKMNEYVFICILQLLLLAKMKLNYEVQRQIQWKFKTARNSRNWKLETVEIETNLEMKMKLEIEIGMLDGGTFFIWLDVSWCCIQHLVFRTSINTKSVWFSESDRNHRNRITHTSGPERKRGNPRNDKANGNGESCAWK